MRTYVLACDTNANYLAHTRFDVLAFVHAFVCLGPGDCVWDQVMSDDPMKYPDKLAWKKDVKFDEEPM
jgi:hypothetical protein